MTVITRTQLSYDIGVRKLHSYVLFTFPDIESMAYFIAIVYMNEFFVQSMLYYGNRLRFINIVSVNGEAL